ncbi:SPOR domain-containing protein [Sphingomonas sp.]|uniref:SPOR domain-containing protein n=1 Tax=Sphingomonas sp. TaxID=28214 RepID=UPI0025CC9B75|nr:SPOR domain-containing protein [Sphingomonas sp.]
MKRISLSGGVALALALVAACAPPALAQSEVVQPHNGDADRLADQMRVLAANPRDLEALLVAGEASARLSEFAAALGFFARAESVDPSNPRIIAGRAMVMVRMERPGEALRMFQAAEARGLPVARFASDRGFAYDLLGAPQLAQKDYQLALAQGRDDETLRRYALSLGITGEPDKAMEQLDPLLRRSDRAAWRTRAFILAMNGDMAGAESIATSMLPGNMAQSLLPFLRRLEGMSVIDRAFAVHFGELSPTAVRREDARTAPSVPAYVPVPRLASTQLTAAPPPGAAPPPVSGPVAGRSSRSRKGQGDLAAMTRAATPPPPPPPQPVQLARREPLPPPPVYVAPPPDPVPLPPPSSGSTQRTRITARPVPRTEEPSGDDDVTEAAPVQLVARPTAAKPAAKPAAKAGEEDSVLAAIINNISVPDSEREALTVPPAAAASARPEPVRVAAAEKPAAAKPLPAKPDAKDPKAAAKPDPKAKKTPPKPDPKKAEPARIWVQVAGGANEDALPGAWKRLSKDAPAAFKGRTAWTTPLRATNRLLAGPFKSDDEAQGFVNQLRKAGISAFVFTSEAGQKIEKLALK